MHAQEERKKKMKINKKKWYNILGNVNLWEILISVGLE